MDSTRLARLEDVTRRYGRYRPCGAGLGVLWGGLLLAALGLMMLRWTTTEYAAHALQTQTLWRFLRDTPLTPPMWLVVAAVAWPFIGWLGLLAIQRWVDGQFGAVTAEGVTGACAAWRPKGPRWLVPAMVVLLACLLSGVVIWDVQTAAAPAVLAMLAIAAWTFVWGRRSRDQLTLLVMFALSVPSLYVIAGTDRNANFAAGNLVIFGSYFVLMLWLLLQGLIRFFRFLKVRADLVALRPVHE